MTFGGHIVYFAARVASFAPERSKAANDATRVANKLCSLMLFSLSSIYYILYTTV